MLTAGHHPCQALADLLTLRETFGTLEGLTLAYVGDGNNVARSLAILGAMAGVEVRVAAPDGYQLEPVAPPSSPTTRARPSPGRQRRLHRRVGEHERRSRDRGRAAPRPRALPARRRAARQAAPDAIALHCLPAHPGEEITERGPVRRPPAHLGPGREPPPRPEGAARVARRTRRLGLRHATGFGRTGSACGVRSQQFREGENHDACSEIVVGPGSRRASGAPHVPERSSFPGRHDPRYQAQNAKTRVPRGRLARDEAACHGTTAPTVPAERNTGVPDDLANGAAGRRQPSDEAAGQVLVTRERIQTTSRRAVERGRMTRGDANELVPARAPPRASNDRRLAPTGPAGPSGSASRSRSSATTSSPRPGRAPAPRSLARRAAQGARLRAPPRQPQVGARGDREGCWADRGQSSPRSSSRTPKSSSLAGQLAQQLLRRPALTVAPQAAQHVARPPALEPGRSERSRRCGAGASRAPMPAGSRRE